MALVTAPIEERDIIIIVYDSGLGWPWVMVMDPETRRCTACRAFADAEDNLADALRRFDRIMELLNE